MVNINYLLILSFSLEETRAKTSHEPSCKEFGWSSGEQNVHGYSLAIDWHDEHI
jgi:hypothetical protein